MDVAEGLPKVAHIDGERLNLIEDHLQRVADLASKLAQAFGAGEWARLAGLWHDLGKFSEDFQSRIRILNDPHSLEMAGRVDHSTAGALHAVQALGARGRKDQGIILAYLIAGHHAGLTDWHTEGVGERALRRRLTRVSLLDDALAGRPPAALLAAHGELGKPPSRGALHLWMRMIFSALIDADRLDTEGFFRPEVAALRRGQTDLAMLAERLAAFIGRISAGAEAGPVPAARASLLSDCRGAAVMPPGLFTLSAPTGSGKTLSSMSFALEHAKKHGLRRVIYVIPYISITEQTADVFRRALWCAGEPDPILEHHSAAQDVGDGQRQRLAAENWDAPVVVTTAVQFWESVFAAHPGRCRKLHNIANSVVIFDEAQTLPVGLLDPILSVLDSLVAHFGVSVVLCTATQPELQNRDDESGRFRGLKGNTHGIREIVSDVHSLHQALRRVRVVVPTDLATPTTWPALAHDVMACHQALTIVDRRRHARDLWELIPGAVHLSAAMCGQHRTDLIAEIKDRLKAKQPLQVVSTQLIEAGVDVDFPVVFRALAGLESLGQAAGRANREGKLEGLGELRIFVAQDKSFDPHLRNCARKAETLLQRHPADPFAPAVFRHYFRDVYWSIDPSQRDANQVLPCLSPTPELGIQFSTAADRFRWIEDDSEQVVVMYGEGLDLIRQLQQPEPDRALMRRAQRYAVSIRRKDMAPLRASGRVLETPSGLLVQVDPALYHPDLGIVVDGAPVPETVHA